MSNSNMFQGNLIAGTIQNHVFSCSHPDIEAIGFHSFTLDSCSRIWNKNLVNIKLALNNSNLTALTEPTATAYGTTFFNNGGGTQIPDVTGVFTYYNKITETIDSGVKKYTEWVNYIKYYEDKTKNPNLAPDKIKDATILAVQTSFSKGVMFKFPGSNLASNITGDVVIFLKFLERKWSSENDMDTRTAGISANVPIVAIAQTAAGNNYSYRRSVENATASTVSQKTSPQGGGIQNPSNTVAAQQDLYFNEGTGKLESGTRRILAVLLSDIDAAPLKKINIGVSDLATLNATDFTNNTTDLFTSYVPTTGMAMPIGPQGNNPNLFLPNFVKDCKNGRNRYEAESITVTNRFRRSYKKGATVFLTRVGNEWIPEEQLQDPPTSALKIGDWTFSKLIADSDNYFKDEGWREGTATNKTITGADYESAARYKFYNNIQTTISSIIGTYYITNSTYGIGTFMAENNTEATANYPSYLSNLKPSRRYLISTIFDQLPEAIGGFQSSSYVGRTNLSKGSPSDGYMEEVGVFWGPIFAEGYNSLLLNKTPTHPPSSGKYFNNETAASLEPHTYLRTTLKVNGSPSYAPAKHDFPAECTSKVLDPIFTFKKFQYLGTEHTSGIVPRALKPPYYYSSKSSVNKVQFIPLSANLVGTNDPNSSNAFLSYERNFKDRMTTYFTDYGYGGLPTNVWGTKMFTERLDVATPNWPPSATPRKCNFKAGFNPIAATNFVPYDCYIQKDANNPPIGYPEQIFDDIGSNQGANCVGIICGRNTVSKRGGGNINFTVTSNFGFEPFSSVSAGNFFLGIIPMGGIAIPLLTTNEVRQSRGKPQYGAYQDDIYSFGTTVLATRVFDSWPEDLTIFDPRYFAVLHFNPGTFGTVPDTISVTYKGASRTVDKIETSVDFRIPTTLNNNIIALETELDKDSTDIRPKELWKVNPIRRGMLLTNGGFTYGKLQIGAFANQMSVKVGPYINVSTGKEETKTFKGKRYSASSKIPTRNGLILEVLSVDGEGGITSIGVAKNSENIEQNGEFLHTDFPMEITLPLPRDNDGNLVSGAEAAIIKVNKGKVYALKQKDLAPVEHVPLTTISSSSNAGKAQVIKDVKTSSFNLASNTTGQYDVFTHFHNDITHTIMYHSLYGRTDLQYITMDIS